MIITTFFLLLSFIPLFQLKNVCDTTTCEGPYQIDIPDIPMQETSWHRESAYLKIYPNTVKGVIGIRESYSAYCYNGGNMDSNSGCYTAYTPLPPNEEELKIWEVKNKCKVGKYSFTDSEYWGSAAKPLWQKNDPVDWVPHSAFTHAGERWMKFAYHTTIYDWACDINVFDFPLYVNGNGTYTYSKKGDLLPLHSNGTFLTIDEKTSMYVHPFEVKEEKYLYLNCVSSPKLPYLCRLPSTMDNKGIPTIYEVSLNEKREYKGWQQNVEVIVHSPTYFDDEPTMDSWTSHKGKNNKRLGVATSVEDLIPIIHSIMMAKEESDYNVMSLVQQIQSLQKVVVKMALASGKVIEDVIPSIAGINGRVKWVTNEVFNICPCFNPKMDPLSTCSNGYYFSGGYLKRGNRSEGCFTMNNKDIKKLVVFNKTQLVHVELDFPPPVGASEEWTGWQWVDEKKEALYNSIVFANSSQTGGNALSFFSDFTPGGLSMLYTFFTSSAFVSYLSLVLSIIALIRR